MLAQARVFVRVGEEKDGGGAGAEAGGHVVDGISDLGVLSEAFVIKRGGGRRIGNKKRVWRRNCSHHDQILGIGQPPRRRNVQDTSRVRFRRAEAAGNDRGDGGVGKESL